MNPAFRLAAAGMPQTQRARSHDPTEQPLMSTHTDADADADTNITTGAIINPHTSTSPPTAISTVADIDPIRRYDCQLTLQCDGKLFGFVMTRVSGAVLQALSNNASKPLPVFLPTADTTAPISTVTTLTELRQSISESFDFATLVRAGLTHSSAELIEDGEYQFVSESCADTIDRDSESCYDAASLLPVARLLLTSQSLAQMIEREHRMKLEMDVRSTLDLPHNLSSPPLVTDSVSTGKRQLSSDEREKMAERKTDSDGDGEDEEDEDDDEDDDSESSSGSESNSETENDPDTMPSLNAVRIDVEPPARQQPNKSILKRRSHSAFALKISVTGELKPRPATRKAINGTGASESEKQLSIIGTVRKLLSVNELLDSRYDSNYDRPDQPVWISVENATDRQIETIGQHFDLHPLTIEDCQSRQTREKLEIFQHYLFLVFHALDATSKPHRRRRRQQASDDEADSDNEDGSNEISMHTAPIKLIVFPHLIVSFATTSKNSTLTAVRTRLRKVYENRLESTAWIIHAVLDCIVDALLPVVDGTVLEVDALEDLIYVLSGSEHRDLLKRMGLTRRRLSFLRQRLWSKRDILMSLIGKDWQLFLAGVQIPYLRDVYDHVVTMLHKVEAGSELLSSLQNTYLANVSIDVADQSKQSNEIMKNLSAVATIVLPLSLVAGIMGMNVQVPWQHDSDNDLAMLAPFIVICGGMVIVTVIMIIYFKARNLL